MRAVVMWHIGLPFQVLVVAMCFFPQPAGLWDPHGVCISQIPHLFCLFSSISLHLFESRIPSSIKLTDADTNLVFGVLTPFIACKF